MTETSKERRKRLDHERYMRNREARPKYQHEYYLAKTKNGRDLEKQRRKINTQRLILLANGIIEND